MSNGVVRFFPGSRHILWAALFALCLTYATDRQAKANILKVPSPYATIQAAVTAANTGDTILIADGTYTGPGNRNIDFGMKDLKIQSASGKPANCILDCQQQGCAFILQNHQTASSIISGFTIKNGTGFNISGEFGTVNKFGGGIYILGSNNAPVVSNCIFTGNSATYGGGMYSGTAINCTFSNNLAPNGGGAMSGSSAMNCTFTSNIALRGNGGAMSGGRATNCLFTGNSAAYGGGMESGTANRCVFSGNMASNYGGGIVLGTAINCIFTGNSAFGGGGMEGGTAINCVFFRNTATKFTSNGVTTLGNGGGAWGGNLYLCTLVGNSALGNGGGVYLYSYSQYNAFVNNCILWGNTAAQGTNNVGGDGGTITYSDIQGGFAGVGNINADPLFVKASTGNLHLTAGSPCISQATTDPAHDYYGAAIPLPAADCDGGSRMVGSAPDMGAYEFGNGGIVGTLAFSGIASAAPAQSVTFQFRPEGGGAAINTTYFTTSDGAFYLHGVPDGSYNLWVKSPTYLAASLPVTVSGGNANNITATLAGGDANNDNTVDIGDFGILVSAFGATGYDPTTGYDSHADFNGDGLINIGDFGLLVNSYGDSGDP